MAIDQSALKNLAEDWDTEHFLCDLPGKWEYSWLSLADDKVAGFSINSIKPTSIHVHRIVVSLPFQGYGIGRRLLRKSAQSASERNIEQLTLRVAVRNETAVQFYRQLGFDEVGTTNGEYLDLAIALNKLCHPNNRA